MGPTRTGPTRTADRLTCSETGELDTARAHLAALVTAARAVVAASGHDPDRGDCAEAGCALADHDDGAAWCGLAQRLGLLEVAAAPPRPPAPTDVPTALGDFRRALLASLDAVRTCRSIAHAEGTCWFTDDAGVDVCGDVLRLAHRVG